VHAVVCCNHICRQLLHRAVDAETLRSQQCWLEAVDKYIVGGPLTPEATMSRVSAREAKQAEKEADVVIASLSRAGDAAISQTLEDICDKLKGNPPLMYHINALLHNDEWTGVLQSSIAGEAATAAAAAATSQKTKVWNLRVAVKKFCHLSRHTHTHTRTHAHTQARTYTHLHIYIYTHVYVYI
jgi:hypothetical protein